MQKPLLLLLTKNARPGHVKTRLAGSVGEQEACRIYQSLLRRAYQITSGLQLPKVIYYDLYIDDRDHWDNYVYVKALQQGESLGERMQHAFQQGFSRGYSPVMVVGTDCPSLTRELIYQAQELLKTHDYVVGPTEAGGYYLLGMNHPTPDLLAARYWQEGQLLHHTLAHITQLSATVAQLPALRDVGCLDDLEWYRNHPDRQMYLPGY
ncbi:MAG: TIGR04282 family arsenosugar biosynthesis glycosyltransferase [Bacteroidetes bacterium]|nr:TIGR04282 family arsenosugar biosynthesis glycosyltransferase [Bacteroidota bacterium]